jgi:hypothetical protein
MSSDRESLTDAMAISINTGVTWHIQDRLCGGDRSVTSDERVQYVLDNFRILVHA